MKIIGKEELHRSNEGREHWRIDQIFEPTLRLWRCPSGYALSVRPAPCEGAEHAFWVTCAVCEPPHRERFAISEIERLQVSGGACVPEQVGTLRLASLLMSRVMDTAKRGAQAGVFVNNKLEGNHG